MITLKSCQQCLGVFVPERSRNKFCSPNCADENLRRVDLEKLHALVMVGMCKADIARELGVSRTTVRRNIADCGLEGTWREQRYG